MISAADVPGLMHVAEAFVAMHRGEGAAARLVQELAEVLRVVAGERAAYFQQIEQLLADGDAQQRIQEMEGTARTALDIGFDAGADWSLQHPDGGMGSQAAIEAAWAQYLTRVAAAKGRIG